MRKMIIISSGVSFIGAIYSFILFYPYFISQSCAFGYSCPMLFTLPVCFYGFLGFLFLFSLTARLWFVSDLTMKNRLTLTFFWATLFGMLFALYFLIQELFTEECSRGECHFSLAYPSCLYGFFLFFLLFLLARRMSKKER